MLVDAIGSEGGTFGDRRHNKAMNQARHLGLIGSNKLALAPFGTRIAAWYLHKLVHARPCRSSDDMVLLFPKLLL